MSSENNELKPCPFCGGDAEMVTDKNIFQGQKYDGYKWGEDTGHRIECLGKCHSMTCWWHLKEQALIAWNTRANPPMVVPAAVFIRDIDCRPSGIRKL